MNNRFSNVDEHPILRMYNTIKYMQGFEHHLKLTTYYRYRNAISKLRANSQTIKIERGRNTNPTTELSKRLCRHCNVLEDERHFILSCNIFTRGERNID